MAKNDRMFKLKQREKLVMVVIILKMLAEIMKQQKRQNKSCYHSCSCLLNNRSEYRWKLESYLS